MAIDFRIESATPHAIRGWARAGGEAIGVAAALAGKVVAVTQAQAGRFALDIALPPVGRAAVAVALTFRCPGEEPVTTTLFVCGDGPDDAGLHAFWRRAGRSSRDTAGAVLHAVAADPKDRGTLLLRGARLCLEDGRFDEAFGLLEFLAREPPHEAEGAIFHARWREALLRHLPLDDAAPISLSRLTKWKTLHALWPGDVEFAVGLLCLYGTTTIAMPDAVACADALEPRHLSDTRIRLLKAHLQLRADDVAAAAAGFAGLPPDPSLVQMPFRRLHGKLGARLLLRLGRGVAWPSPETGAADGVIDAILVAEFRRAARDGQLHDVLGEMLVWNDHGIADVAERGAGLLRRLVPEFDLEAATDALAYFSARDMLDDARVVVDAWRATPQAAVSAAFCKRACVLAIKCRDRRLERAVLDGFDAEAAERAASSDLERARIHELIERRRFLESETDRSGAPSAGRPVRVFVGLYGQLRGHQKALPDLVQMLRDDMGHGIGGRPAELSFALASWNRPGDRGLRADDRAANMLFPKLPAPLKNALQTAATRSVEQLTQMVPNIMALVLARSDATADDPISVAMLQAMLGEDAALLIDDEDAMEARLCTLDFDLHDAPYAADRRRDLGNQLKMWSRIARLAAAARDMEAHTGQEFDACVLARADLRVMRGGFRAFAADCLLPGNADKIYSDNQLRIEFFEGVGDCYFVAARRGLSLLETCYSGLEAALQPSAAPPYRRVRTSAHLFIGSLMFAGGFSSQTGKKPLYVIDRLPVPPLADFLPAIARDAEACGDEAVRAALLGLLGQAAPI